MGALLRLGAKPFAVSPPLGWLSPLLSLLAGLAQAISIAAPWSGQPLWWLQLASLGLLAWQVNSAQSWRRAAVLGWLFALAWLSGTFWWLFIALHTYGGLPALLAAPAVLALAALLALYYATACGVFVALVPAKRSWGALFFAALWTLAELARGVWFTGFGWGASGYAHVDGLLAGYAPWLGVYGLCALAAWLAMSLPRVLADGRWQPGVVLAALVVLTLPTVYQMSEPGWSRPAGRLAVTLLQGNIPQDEKFQPGSGIPLALKWYAEQLQDSRTALVIAPETAIPLLPQQLPPGYWEALEKRFSEGQQAALIGMPLGSYQEGYTNSVVGLKPAQAQAWRYDKYHLVPFGEFIPAFFKWFTAMMNIPLGDFNRGAVRQAPFEWQGQRLAPNICYEDLFGEELGLRFVDPTQAPTILVNISNLAWYGNSLAMDQHLQIARMRTREFERPFVLATNTGVTAILDHRGHIAAAIPRDTRAVLVGEVEGRHGITPYAWWVSRFGLWPLWIGAASLVLLAWLKRRRQSSQADLP